ncbi:unnamed protein product, partial [Rotaria sp. Silwood2]
MNNITHSYTVQPITSADGQLLHKFFLILQEKEKEFGERVEKDLIVPPNVVVRASKSGKSSNEKHRIFLNEVLSPLVDRKFLLFLDCWPTQADLKKLRTVFAHQDSQLLIFPKGSTGYIQPQDLSLFRSWRFIHEKIEHYIHVNRTEMNLNKRQYFVNMHSIIHNQLCAPQFKNHILSCFYTQIMRNIKLEYLCPGTPSAAHILNTYFVPYNPAIQINHIVYLSGQIGIDPITNQLVSDDIQNQTKQALHNIQTILHAAGSDLNQIARCVVLLTDMNDYQLMNQIYASFFLSNDDYPARTTLAVQSLPANAKVEIECTAYTRWYKNDLAHANCHRRLIISSY